jgi:FAD/FMN-containing dehydrogenase
MPSPGPGHTFTHPVAEFAAKKAALTSQWDAANGQFRLAKSTVSNLFRYQPRAAPAQALSLGHFNEIIAFDSAARTLDVEGLATFETIVAHCLPRGYLPPVTPELKHITIGGATVGIGIESTGFRHGFVHDALLEAEVLLPGGEVVTCTADNEHADLFRALPNSYGTLGYILRVRLALIPARPFVHLQIEPFDSSRGYLDAMQRATQQSNVDFVEGLFFEDGRYYLMTGRFADEVPQVDDILRRHVFYRLVQERRDVYLATADYIFRYDPEWFWNIPDTAVYSLFRRYAPRRFRNSGFYTRYAAWKARMLQRMPGGPSPSTEPLIQDWEVPWDAANELIGYCLREVELDGRPWAVVPIRTQKQPTLYPVAANTLYFNLGCYCQVRRAEGREPYHYSKIMDRKCFELGGIKMLYSSTFLAEAEFDARFNGEAYRALKAKYDPRGCAPTLYQKVAMRPDS